MFFSIPESSERSGNGRVRFYHIHLNGIHQFSCRYSEFHRFHADLIRLYPNIHSHLQAFPPKKLFQLSSDELEERRFFLERYLQSISQHPLLLASPIFNQFFFNLQRETCRAERLIDPTIDKVHLTVDLLNEHPIELEQISPDQTTDQIYRLCANQFQIDRSLQSYWNLFFYYQENHHYFLIRPAFPFESPFYSLKQLEKHFQRPRLVLRKSYWNLDDDLKLIESPATRDLLFIQAIYDLEQTRLYLPEVLQEQFHPLNNEHPLKDQILLLRQAKFYGYLLIPSCSIVYPHDFLYEQEEHLPCLLAIGNYELICSFPENAKEFLFKVTRIRCWKVNRTKQQSSITFEYLFRRDQLQWITIHSEQAPLISTCLQSMVDEILSRRDRIVSNSATTKPNLLRTRTQMDLDRLNNNSLFDQITGDDDL